MTAPSLAVSVSTVVPWAACHGRSARRPVWPTTARLSPTASALDQTADTHELEVVNRFEGGCDPCLLGEWEVELATMTSTSTTSSIKM